MGVFHIPGMCVNWGKEKEMWVCVFIFMFVKML